ncbi:MAG: DUF6382 domain-containing protein, partial [Lachnospiraceae bacterium]|nr:DUF6382 domain-containing protein [Lachnospiraceae bacterium]
MNKWYKNNERGKVLEVFEEDSLDSVLDTTAIGIIMSNNIPYLIPLSFSQVDETRYVKFDISSRIGFREFMCRDTTFKTVAKLFINICDSFVDMHKYMIDTGSLVTDFDMMFFEPANSLVSFIVNPDVSKHRPLDYSSFFKNILFELRITDAANVGIIINMLNSPSFSLEEFSQQLRRQSGLETV